jgi:hypothetical protein
MFPVLSPVRTGHICNGTELISYCFLIRSSIKTRCNGIEAEAAVSSSRRDM